MARMTPPTTMVVVMMTASVDRALRLVRGLDDEDELPDDLDADEVEPDDPDDDTDDEDRGGIDVMCPDCRAGECPYDSDDYQL